MGYCSRTSEDDEYDTEFDCLDYMECEECPYWKDEWEYD